MIRRLTTNVYLYLGLVLALSLWLAADDLQRIVYEWSLR